MGNHQKPMRDVQNPILSGAVPFDDLKENAAPFVDQHRMRVGRPSPLPVFNGQFGIQYLGGGQTVHLSKVEQDADFETSFTAGTGMLVTVILSGRLEFALDGQNHDYTAENGPLAVAWMNRTPVEVVRKSRAGDGLVKVQLHTLLEHLDEESHAGTDGFAGSHDQVVTWHPGRSVTEAATGMMRAQTLSPLRARMASGRFAIEAMDSLLQFLERRKTAGSRQHIAEAHAYVEHTAHDKPTLGQIAAATGFSVSALQRAYRAAYGMTVIEHQRRVLLEQAMEGLRSGQMTVSQAARQAGYNSPSNFTSAFSRQFGLCPSQLRS